MTTPHDDQSAERSHSPAQPTPELNTPAQPHPAGRSEAADLEGPLVQERRGGLSTGMWTALIVGALLLVLFLVFIIQNNQAVYIEYFGFAFEMQLGVAMLISAIAGVLIAGIIGSVRIFQLSLRLRRLRKALNL